MVSWCGWASVPSPEIRPLDNPELPAPFRLEPEEAGDLAELRKQDLANKALIKELKQYLADQELQLQDIKQEIAAYKLKLERARQAAPREEAGLLKIAIRKRTESFSEYASSSVNNDG